MESGFPVDAAILLAGVLLAVGAAARPLTDRFRVPGLLLFLGLGMIVADDGLALVRFDDTALAQQVAVVALAIILFDGGLTTGRSAVRRAGAPAVAMATVGVAITGAVVAAAAHLLLDLDGTTALILGAVVASTDAAAVFSALRHEHLPARVRDLLQLESGANDPIAVLLTVGFVEVWRTTPSVGEWLAFGSLQLFGGAMLGMACGAAGLWLFRRLHIAGDSASGVLALGIGGVAYGVAAVVGASGFLAVYLAGLILARDERIARGLRSFVEGLAASAEAVLFLLLGLLVFPSELLNSMGTAAVIALVLVVVARPLATHLLLPAFGFTVREQVVVAWAGLRGAVPIVLATVPLTAGHPDGNLVFEVAFVVAVASVAVQGPTVSRLARRLGVTEAPPTASIEVIALDELDADVIELLLEERSALEGAELRNLPPPGGARVAVVIRNGLPHVPDGSWVFAPGDRLVVVTPVGTDAAPLLAWASG